MFEDGSYFHSEGSPLYEHPPLLRAAFDIAIQGPLEGDLTTAPKPQLGGTRLLGVRLGIRKLVNFNL